MMSRKRSPQTLPLHKLLTAGLIASWGISSLAQSYQEVQLAGLQAFFESTNGERWSQSMGWLDTSVELCGWYGVTCDESGENVTGLALPGNGLIGDLSTADQFFDIVSIKNVDLSDNELTGPVVLGFGIMPNLEMLDLSRNNLVSFPSNWGSEASSLQHLLLQHNSIFG